MGDIGYRRKGDMTPLYHPERDYAYITPTLMRIAIEALDSKEPAEKVKWRLDNDITQQAVAQIAETLARSQSDFVNAADPVSGFEAALERHGFFEFNYATRQFLFASIGEVLCAAWFLAVREVSTVGEESPAAVEMARFTAAVRSFVSNAGLPVYDINYVAEYRAMQAKTLQTRIAMLEQEVAKHKENCQRLAYENAKLQPAAKKSWLCRLVGFFRNTPNA